ncbi:armadillo-type protein [Cristinia sonorae]|uniref:Armadillo-type protein n=1 Tax=Cristinia sonorae TaxID=1940300 RepID=A0A8K0UGG1_9AGAR|nr:armadillo-type protein [Cristinia sonorae]
MKTATREACVVAIVSQSNPDVGAWTMVSACKSVSQTLHTTTASLFAPVIRHYLTCDDPEASYTVLRRSYTALAHHCKSAEQYTPTVEYLIEQLVSADRSDTNRLDRILEIITTPCSVRQGSRLSQNQISTLLSQFQTLPLTDLLHASILKFTTAVLMAGEMASWLGPGRKVFERVWERPILGLELCGALSDLGWGGWKMLALPHVLKRVPDFLESHPSRTLEMLVSLQKQGRLQGVDASWKSKLQKWVDARFSTWDSSTEQMLELSQVLSLSSLLPSFTPLLIQLVNTALGASEPYAQFEAQYANASWLLGSCLHALSERGVKEWSDSVELSSWTAQIATKWAWSGYCLEGLVTVLSKSSSSTSELLLEDLYVSVQTPILSHSRTLRLSVLRLLSSRAVKTPQSTAEVFKRMLQGEEVALDVQGVRERVVKITRLGQVLRDDDEFGANIAIRWLIAQLKVNLRPLWKPASEALSSLSQRFGDLVWKLLFEEIRKVSNGETSHSTPEWMSELSDDELDPISEDEKTWRDPSAHKLRSSITLWMRGDAAHRSVVQSQTIPERFDVRSYELQLLATLGECSALAEKHSRDLIPLFLSLAPPDDPTRMPKHKLIAWLELFSKFSNPKALRSTQDVHRIYLTLASHPDRPLQRLALACILTYKSSHLIAHQDKLRLLLDDTRWRDELTSLDFNEIEPSDRPEFVDLLVRLLFGVMLERRGRSRGADRRAAVLTVLSGCSDGELELLADLMLKPLKRGRDRYMGGEFTIQPMDQDVSDKQMVGFLTLLEDVMRNMGSKIVRLWPALLSTLLDIVAYAQARVTGHGTDADIPAQEEEEDPESEDTKENGSSRTISTIRQLGLKRLADFFRAPILYQFDPYMKAAFDSFISPRLPSFATENTQAPSALLELFYVWSSRPEYTPLLCEFDNRVLPQIYNCLIATSVKEPVITKVFDIVDRLLETSAEDSSILGTILKPHVSLLLTNLSVLVERTKGLNSITDPVGRRQISILSRIATWLTDSSQASTLLGLFTPILRKPTRIVPEKLKVDMINILQSLFPLVSDLADPSSPVYTKTYSLLSFLFQNLRSRPGRLALLTSFHKLVEINPSLTRVSALLDELNAYSKRRIDDPDFDRRLTAFGELNESLHSSLSSQDWLPIIYNMLHLIQDPEELTVRNNASHALKRFVDLAAGSDASYEWTFLKVLYPGLKNGLRTKNELVRAEILGIISHAVERCTRISALQEMRVLLANGDEEANFFNNIHHVQIHRRTRALRRLADYCDEGHLRNATLTDVFIPLVSNFVQTTGNVDHHLVNEAILTTGRMAKHLSWGSYYALVQNYLRLSRQRDASERVYVRTIVAILDNFHFSMDTVVKESESTIAEQDVADGEDGDVEADEEEAAKAAKLANQQSHVADVVNSRLLPALLQHLEKRDETEDSLRIPVAVGIVQVALHLPQKSREIQVSRLLTVLSQVLRSKSQETRDLTRETMCKIAIILGPSYLHVIIRELRAALLRGPHLHVLAFTTHALLVHVTSEENAPRFHTLDDSVNDVAHISSEVIFGESGKDVLADEFKTKMREVRASGSKGFDSFAIISKYTTPPKISSLLVPVRNILHETETLRVMQQVEDLLRRIAGGLNANEHLKPVDLLQLCHTLVSQNSQFLKQSPNPGPRKGGKGKKDDRLVQLKRKAGPDMDHFATNSFRFVVFGLELFNTAHRRGRFDFQDAAIISRLESMVSVIGNTLYSNQQQVIIPGLKAASAIVKCPLKSIEKSLPVFVRQIIDIIKNVGSTDSEAVQNAFKALATILRDQPKAQVKEKDLIFLLELIGPDLEEPTRQQAVFTMLRAIVVRKFVVPEIYDLMNKTSEIMVTNQSPQVQELARGVLLQFLLEYPQGKGRLRNHMTFFAKNLSYVHESGRKSVMELLNAVLTKFNPDLLREFSDLLFVALVMVIANDDSAKCREMASEVIKGLFMRLEDNQRRVILSHVHSWSIQHSQPQLCRVSSQIYRIIIDLLQQDVAQHAHLILTDLNAILQVSANSLEEASLDEGADLDIEWQIPYHALNALTKLLEVCPDLATAEHKVQWPHIISHLLFPHPWVRTASCRLQGVLFTAVPVVAPRTDLPEDSPFSRFGMEDVAKKLCLQLRSQNLDGPLGLLIVKNLFFIGKCFSELEAAKKGAKEEEDDDSEDEDEESGDEAEDEGEPQDNTRHPLSWLFSKLSYQIRAAQIARRNKSSSSEGWYHQPASVLRWFAAMTSFLQPSEVEKYLTHMLSPVYRLTEEDTIRDPQLDELKTLAVELQDLVQAKVGTTMFANVYSKIRQNVLGVRHERRTKKAVQTHSNPALAMKRKQQRNVAKKDSRKRKNSTFA